MKLKRFLWIAALSVMIFLISYVAYADSDINILVNGEILPADESYITETGAMLPVRAVAQKLGYEVSWHEKTKSATFLKGGTFLTIDTVNNLAKTPDGVISLGAAEIKNGKLFVPLRIISDCFDCSALYSGKSKTVSIKNGNNATLHFLDCGQADCIFIELPDNRCMLIDSGNQGFSEKLIPYISSLGYSHIDYVVATHPHSDHIGSMPEILDAFSVGEFFMPNVTHTTKNFENMLDSLSKNGCKRTFISSGTKLFEGVATCLVLAPKEKEYTKLNNYSAVLKLDFDDVSIILSADAEHISELEMINSGQNLDADILKAGHHGSDSSSTDGYLSAVTPEVGVISVGKNNKYDFPSYRVLDRFKEYGTEVFRTDIHGNIIITTDGYIYTVDTAS